MLKGILETFICGEIAKHHKRQNEIYVTDLFRCWRKAQFENVYHETTKQPNVLIGILLHKALEEIFQQYLPNNEEIRIEPYVEKKIYINSHYFVYLTGRPDILTPDSVIEIKYSRNKDPVQESHKYQVSIYMLLTKRQKGTIFYITPDTIKEYVVLGSMTEAELQKMVKEYVENKPTPKYGWECAYCPYKEKCKERK